ncbi:MAG: allantoicase [Thiofilum sp.]|uniref:allantoicase n=1 Tax=Thiofilum sp. TaxID=2212733 RepID=UPI0025ED6002|nr:allantoicase [Thiofilum sp.]MBK8453057.1 allantoicase [Thiofilum sp.]
MALPGLGAPITAPAADLPDWAKRSTNLANAAIGAKALFATDEFFAPLERMLNPEPAVFTPGLYDDHGKYMDGWETRRKRTTGYDWALVKLARAGTIEGFDIDTSHFTGNYAPAVSIEATDCDSEDLEALAKAQWTTLLPSTSLKGNSHNLIKITPEQTWRVLRVNMYPDGGIARLRVYGKPMGVFDRSQPDTIYDLIALENGGRAVAWNDAHYGEPSNIIMPERGINMGDGWETRRRREPGNDWCILQLGATGIVESIEVDTAHFKGNYPDRFSIQAARMEGGTDQSVITQSMFWDYLIPEQKLTMDAIHHFKEQIISIGAITHIRLNIIPDGGISRLRLWGKVVS